MSKFGMEVTALVIEHYPLAVKGDPGQIAAALSELATCLGGLLAFAFRFGGEAGAVKATQVMLQKIYDNATAIDAKAGEIVRRSTALSSPSEH